MPTRILIHEGQLNAILHSPDGAVAQDIVKRGQRVLERARALAPKRTGKMAASLQMTLETDGQELAARIGSDLNYTIFVHEGTGIYAGRGPITPRSARVLSWVQNGERVYARKVRGQPAQPFLLEALKAFD